MTTYINATMTVIHSDAPRLIASGLDMHISVKDNNGSPVPLMIRATAEYVVKNKGAINACSVQDITKAFQPILQEKFDREYKTSKMKFRKYHDFFSHGCPMHHWSIEQDVCKVKGVTVRFTDRSSIVIPFFKTSSSITCCSKDGVYFDAKAVIRYQQIDTRGTNRESDATLASRVLDTKIRLFRIYWEQRAMKDFVETYNSDDTYEKSAIWNEPIYTDLVTERYDNILILDMRIQIVPQFWKNMTTAFESRQKERKALVVHYGRFVCGLIGAIPCAGIIGCPNPSKYKGHRSAIKACNRASKTQWPFWLLLLVFQAFAAVLWYKLSYQLVSSSSCTVLWPTLLAALTLAFGPLWLVLSALL